MKTTDGSERFAPHANIRTDGYVILASLLGQTPSEDLRKIIQNLEWDEAIPGKLSKALGALRQAGCDYPLDTIEAEFNKLFVGLGRGEMVPYASWYREKKIQSLPLVSLRSDLMRLGIVRREECHEPEDHAGALCEIMALLSQRTNNISPARQAKFFQEHIATWMTAFFQDLRSAKSAAFYRTVGMFGGCFLESENEYLKYAGDQFFREGGACDEKRTIERPADVY